MNTTEVLQIYLFSARLTNAGLKNSCSQSNLVYVKPPSVSSLMLMLMENFQKLSLVSLWAHLHQGMQYHARETADLAVNELEHHITMQQY